MDISTVNFWIGILVLLGGVGAGVYRIGFVTGKLIETIKAEFNARIELMEDKQAKEVKELKLYMENFHVRKDICLLTTSNFCQAIKDVDVKVSILDRKFDALKDHLMGDKK